MGVAQDAQPDLVKRHQGAVLVHARLGGTPRGTARSCDAACTRDGSQTASWHSPEHAASGSAAGPFLCWNRRIVRRLEAVPNATPTSEKREWGGGDDSWFG